MRAGVRGLDGYLVCAATVIGTCGAKTHFAVLIARVARLAADLDLAMRRWTGHGLLEASAAASPQGDAVFGH